jgi:hypothetical protein
VRDFFHNTHKGGIDTPLTKRWLILAAQSCWDFKKVNGLFRPSGNGGNVSDPTDAIDRGYVNVAEYGCGFFLKIFKK